MSKKHILYQFLYVPLVLGTFSSLYAQELLSDYQPVEPSLMFVDSETGTVAVSDSELAPLPYEYNGQAVDSDISLLDFAELCAPGAQELDGSCPLNTSSTKVFDISDHWQLTQLDLHAPDASAQEDLDFLLEQISQNLEHSVFRLFFTKDPVESIHSLHSGDDLHLHTVTRSFKDPTKYCTNIIDLPFAQQSTTPFSGGSCGQIATNYSLERLGIKLGGRNHFVTLPSTQRKVRSEKHNPQNIRDLTPSGKGVGEGMTLGEIANAHKKADPVNSMKCKIESVSCDGTDPMAWEHVDIFIGNLTEKMKSTTPKYDCSLAFDYRGSGNQRMGHIEHVSTVEKGVITTVNGFMQGTPPNNVPSDIERIGLNKYSRVGQTGALCKGTHVSLYTDIQNKMNNTFNKMKISNLATVCCWQ